MQGMIKLILFSLLFNCQGCQTITQFLPFSTTKNKIEDDTQVHSILIKAIAFQQLNELQKQTQCNAQKQIYKTKPDWQTAWLLIYSLNDDFKCIDLKKTITLADSIQNTQGVSPLLLAFNKNQSQLLTTLDNVHIQLKKLQTQNKQLQSNLNTVKTQLQQVIFKIQELKTIETHINKKLDNTPFYE